MSRRRAAALTAGYYAVIFAALGAYLPYWPAWMDAWGLDRADIGFFLGAATIARIVGSTFIPALADRFAVRRWVVAGASLATAAVFLVHLAIDSRGPLLGATLVLAAVMAPTIPLGEALGLRAAGRYGFSYAPIRAAGSVGFLLANVAMGWALDRFDPDFVTWAVTACFLALSVLGAMHPGGGAAAAGPDRTVRGEAFRLLATPAFAVFAVAVAFGQASHGVYYVYSVLAWQDQGLSGSTIGWLWAFGVIAETALMLGPGRQIVTRIGPATAIGAGAAAGVVRWSLMSFEPSLTWLWPLQGLHALTFALAHLGAMAFLALAVPPRLASSAQGLVSGIAMGLIGAAAVALAAIIVRYHGVGAAYLFAAVMSAISLAAAAGLRRTWSGQRLADQTLPGN